MLFLVLFRHVHSLNMRKYETIFHVYQTMEYTCYDITIVDTVKEEDVKPKKVACEQNG